MGVDLGVSALAVLSTDEKVTGPRLGGQVVVTDRRYRSSKMCSACAVCGSGHDRDMNAAVNLRNHAVSSTAKACGEASSGRGSGVRRIVPAKPASAKQQVSFEYV